MLKKCWLFSEHPPLAIFLFQCGLVKTQTKIGQERLNKDLINKPWRRGLPLNKKQLEGAQSCEHDGFGRP